MKFGTQAQSEGSKAPKKNDAQNQPGEDWLWRASWNRNMAADGVQHFTIFHGDVCGKRAANCITSTAMLMHH